MLSVAKKNKIRVFGFWLFHQGVMNEPPIKYCYNNLNGKNYLG